MVSPTPEPFDLVVKKGSNTRPRWFAAIPRPRSSTRIVTCRAVPPAVTTTVRWVAAPAAAPAGSAAAAAAAVHRQHRPVRRRCRPRRCVGCVGCVGRTGCIGRGGRVGCVGGAGRCVGRGGSGSTGRGGGRRRPGVVLTGIDRIPDQVLDHRAQPLAVDPHPERHLPATRRGGRAKRPASAGSSSARLTSSGWPTGSRMKSFTRSASTASRRTSSSITSSSGSRAGGRARRRRPVRRRMALSGLRISWVRVRAASPNWTSCRCASRRRRVAGVVDGQPGHRGHHGGDQKRTADLRQEQLAVGAKVAVGIHLHHDEVIARDEAGRGAA